MAASTDSRNRGSGPVEEWVAITKSDSTILDPRPRAIMVTVAGDLNMVDNNGNTVVFTVIAGIIYPLSPTKVMSTSTTATGIIGLY